MLLTNPNHPFYGKTPIEIAQTLNGNGKLDRAITNMEVANARGPYVNKPDDFPYNSDFDLEKDHFLKGRMFAYTSKYGGEPLIMTVKHVIVSHEWQRDGITKEVSTTGCRVSIVSEEGNSYEWERCKLIDAVVQE